MVNNIYTVVLGQDTTQHKGWRYTLIHLGMKFLAAILPIGVSFFVANLVFVTKYAGLIGFFICFYFPIVLQLRSQWFCQKMFSHILNNVNLTVQVEEDVLASNISEKTPLLSSSVPFLNVCLHFYVVKVLHVILHLILYLFSVLLLLL